MFIENNQKIGQSIKYLGLLIDKKLAYTEHMQEMRRKVIGVVNKIINVAKKIYES